MTTKVTGNNQGTAYLAGRRRRIISMIVLAATLLLIIVVATTIGSVHIPLDTTFKVILDKLPGIDITHTWTDGIGTIIFDVRLPRVILAGIVGAALAIAGATYQGLFRNPLADPYLIGVAQGASLGAVVGFLLPVAWNLTAIGIIPVFAFTGAILATAVVYLLARVGKTLPVTTLILSGVALSALLSSVVSYLVISSNDQMHNILFWMMGSFSMSEWSEVGIALPYITVGIAIIVIFARLLNVMQLDEEQAQQLGVNVEKYKIILLAAATLITAASVSFVGTIGFVGIIIPHAVRLIWGADHRSLLPLSILTGAVFMIGADLLSRTILAPKEIPIGVITAICGAPFFLYLLRKRKKAIF
jgi:iron complex transport system permease protein